MYPNTYYQGNAYGLNDGTKGYSNYQTYPPSYTSTPVHGQYWTGYAQSYPQHAPQQYGTYGSYNTGYLQNGAYVPQQFYSQPYPQYGPVNYGHYPGFDARYWTGNHYQQPVPVYHQPVPMYHHGVPVYPAYPQYPNHYYPKGYPYYKKRPGKGFLGGSGDGIGKTLLGAVVVGAVAGAVARGK